MLVGMVAEMVDAVVLVDVPMLVGELKLPLAFESCAVNNFYKIIILRKSILFNILSKDCTSWQYITSF